MGDKIVAPVTLSGDVAEVALEFDKEDLVKTKAANQGHGAAAMKAIDSLEAPTVALPRTFLNHWELTKLKDEPLLDAKVKALLKDYQFQLIEIPASFKASAGTRIASAALEVTLSAVGTDSPPTVYRIIPEMVTTTTKEKTEYGLDPSFKVTGIADISVGKWLKTIEISNLKPRINGFWHENGARWEMTPEGDAGVEGTKAFYVLMQQSRKKKECKLSLRANASVATKYGLIFTRTKDYAFAVDLSVAH